MAVPITVIRKSDGIPLFTRSFEKTATGMAIIQELNSRHPPEANKCYNLWKDQACTQNISYIQLTLPLPDLQITGDTTLFATVDTE